MTDWSLRPSREEGHLSLEEASPVRYKRVGGIPYAMAGASLEHHLYRKTPAGFREEGVEEALSLPCPEGTLRPEEISKGAA
ncbi:MAG: hypothetical protein ACK4HT_03615 [Thermus caldifontis]